MQEKGDFFASVALSIFYLFEEQSISRHRLTSLTAALALNDGAELLQGHSMASHLNEGSNNSTYHVSQKAIGLDNKYPIGTIEN